MSQFLLTKHLLPSLEAASPSSAPQATKTDSKGQAGEKPGENKAGLEAKSSDSATFTPRVVNVASFYASGLDLRDLEFKTRRYASGTFSPTQLIRIAPIDLTLAAFEICLSDELTLKPNSPSRNFCALLTLFTHSLLISGTPAYKQSKQANRMLTKAWADTLAAKNSPVIVNAAHPGVVTSKLLKNLGIPMGYNSARSAAATPIFLATQPKSTIGTGGYFAKLKREKCAFSQNSKAIQGLWEACEACEKACAAKK